MPGRLLSGTRLWSGSGFSAENPRHPAPGAVGRSGAELGRKPSSRSGAFVVFSTLPECLPEVSLTFSVVSLPDGGRRVLLGASRPTEHPLPTPADNLAGSRPTRTSLWPGRFSRKIDACHKPLGKRHPALVLREPPVLRDGLQSVLFPGEVLRANGAPGRAKAVKGRAVSRRPPFGVRKCVPSPLCAWRKGRKECGD